MDELFKKAESRINAIKEERDNLSIKHNQLMKAKALLAKEKEQLLQNQKKVITQIENMIARLKSIEGLT